MYKYQHHIRDFALATRHLELLEKGIYREVLDLYYDNDGPLPADLDFIAKRILARSPEERAALSSVMEEFFFIEGGKYHNNRAEEVIAEYVALGEAGRKGALARWGKVAPSEASATPMPPECDRIPTALPSECDPNAIAMRSHVDRNANQKPETINQSNTPLIPLEGEKAETRKAEDAVIPEVLDTPAFREAWGKWLKYRRLEKRKRVSFGAAERHLENLAGHGEAAALAAIKRAMEGEWQGLHPERGRIEKVRTETPAVQGARDWSKEKGGSYL